MSAYIVAHDTIDFLVAAGYEELPGDLVLLERYQRSTEEAE
jgi:hypothetical protein